MKMKKTAGLVAILLICLAVPVWAQEWVKISENDEGIYYFNRRSVENQRDYVTGWVRQELSAAGKSMFWDLAYMYGREPSFVMILWAAKKGSRQTSIFQAVVYDNSGNLIVSQSGSGQWNYCIPGSLQERFWEAIMKAAGIRY